MTVKFGRIEEMVNKLLLLSFLLGSFQNIAQSVDPLTGRLQFSIPLGQLQALDVTLPIGIYHQGGALRVPQGNGSCGMGWNLSAGGAVTRVVRGLPDDYNVANDQRKGWLFDGNATSVNGFTPSGDDNLTVCTDELSDWNYLQGRGYTKDTEPDIYYISAPGVSAQFIFGTDGSPKLLTHQDIQITVTKDSNQVITGFTVKTNTGMTYSFYLRENVARRALRWKQTDPPYFLTEYNQYNTELVFTSAWLLNTAQSTATGTIATFTYADGEEAMGSRFYTRIKPAAINTADTLYYVRDRVTPKLLNQISLKEYRANIFWNNGLVTRVTFDVVSPGTDVKEYDLVYTSLHSATDVSESKSLKSFLKEIKQVRNCNPYPSYSFTYGDINLTLPSAFVPWENNFGQDWFGHHNGVTANKNIPTVYFYNAQTNEKRLRINQNGTATSTFTGTDRSPALLKAQLGALIRIDFPTGGYTAIDYELNNYKETSIATELIGSGVRVKKITSNGGEAAFGKQSTEHSTYRALTKDYEYKLNDGSSSGKILYPPAFAFATGDSIIRTVNSLSEASEVMYTRVKEIILGQGSRVFEFDIPGTFPSQTDGLWKASKSKIARNSANGCAFGNLANGYYSFPFAPSSNYNFAQGLLTKTTEYSETGTPVRERTITYAELTSNPVTLKGLVFEKIGNIYHYGQYEMLTGRMKVISQEVVKEMSEETPALTIQTTVAYAYNVKHMLETVTTTNPDGSIGQEKIKYAANYTLTTPTDTASIALKALNDTFRQGEVVERINRFTPVGGTEKVVGAELITYRDFGGGRVLPYYIRTLPKGFDLTESSISGQSLAFDGDYILVKTLKEIDTNGFLINEYDNKKNKSGYHFDTNLAIPVATFYNAKAQHAIYEGFENATGRGLTSTPFTSPSQLGWTGDKAFLLTTSNKLVSSATNLIQKGETSYRVSCWVKAAQATNITFRAKNGATEQAAVILSNSVNNQWVYLEGVMNMAAVSNTFTLEVASSNTITIDDVVFTPKSSQVAFSTFKPMLGITSSTDDRGNSVTYAYDEYGRLRSTFDRNRNLIKRNEYVLQVETLPTLNPNFTSSVNTYQTGQQVTFTAEANCQGVTYAWVLKQGATTVATGSNSTFQYTFNSLGQYGLSLTVASSFGQASFTDDICVNYSPISPTITVTHLAATDPLIEYSCNSNDNTKTFTVTNLPTGQGLVKTYVWAILLSNGFWSEIPDTNNLSSIEYSLGGGNYTIRCVVGVQFSQGSCSGNMPIISTNTVQVTITYVNNEPCQ